MDGEPKQTVIAEIGQRGRGSVQVQRVMKHGTSLRPAARRRRCPLLPVPPRHQCRGAGGHGRSGSEAALPRSACFRNLGEKEKGAKLSIAAIACDGELGPEHGRGFVAQSSALLPSESGFTPLCPLLLGRNRPTRNPTASAVPRAPATCCGTNHGAALAQEPGRWLVQHQLFGEKKGFCGFWWFLGVLLMLTDFVCKRRYG